MSDNLFVQCPDVKIGGGSGGDGSVDPKTPDGADVDAINNVILETNDITSTAFLGRGLTLHNIRNSNVSGNIIAHEISDPINTYGISVGRSNHAVPNVAITGNTLYRFRRGAIRLTHNGNVSQEEHNNYWDAETLGWTVQGTNRNSEDLTFVDPMRSIATYSQSIGGAGTFDDFISEARQQRKGNWRPAYTAMLANAYIRAGLVEGTSNQPPVAVDDHLTSVKYGANPVGLNVLANDSDPDGDTLQVSSVEASAALVGAVVTMSYGSVTIASDGTASYTLDHTSQAIKDLTAGQTLTEAVTYTCSDGSLESQATLTVTIEGVNNFVIIPIPAGATEVKVEFQ